MKPLAPNLQLNTIHFSPMNRISWTEGCENGALTRGAQRRLPTLMVQLGQVLIALFLNIQSFCDTVVEQDRVNHTVEIDDSLTL